MSKIVEMHIENFMGIKAFRAKPDGHIVQINGANGAGKSSVLDAITSALGGVSKKSTPMPIRKGEESAHIIIETDELTVTRRYTKKNSTVEVTAKDGSPFPKAQAKLDSLLGKLSLDPFAFTMLQDKAQLEQLIGLVDLPFDPKELEAERKRIYDDRADIGRQEKAIGAIVVDNDLPAEEQSASELIASINQAHDYNRQISQARQTSMEIQDRIERLENELSAARQELSQALNVARKDEIDVSEREAQLTNIEDTNAAIRLNNQARDKQREKELLSSQYEQRTEQITELDKQKADGLAAANMPIPGLGFDEHGVTFEGVPFKQTNTASQLRVSFAMAMALNPDLRVVRIKEGSLLDDANMAIIGEMAAEHDFQVWIEVVGNGDGTGIVIEDGEVKA